MIKLSHFNSECEQTITYTFPLLQSEARPHLQNDPDNQWLRIHKLVFNKMSVSLYCMHLYNNDNS